MNRFIHNKSQKVYYVQCEVVNATNGDSDGQTLILYINKEGLPFVRDKDEFFRNFSLYKDEEYIPISKIQGVVYRPTTYDMSDYY